RRISSYPLLLLCSRCDSGLGRTLPLRRAMEGCEIDPVCRWQGNHETESFSEALPKTVVKRRHALFCAHAPVNFSVRVLGQGPSLLSPQSLCNNVRTAAWTSGEKELKGNRWPNSRNL